MNDDGDKYRGQEITIMKIKKDLKMGALAVFLTLALVLVSGTSAYAQTVPREELDAYIEKAMDEREVPGLAIAIVENETVVFALGYGVREISDPTPVDEHTVFVPASATVTSCTWQQARLSRRQQARAGTNRLASREFLLSQPY